VERVLELSVDGGRETKYHFGEDKMIYRGGGSSRLSSVVMSALFVITVGDCLTQVMERGGHWDAGAYQRADGGRYLGGSAEDDGGAANDCQCGGHVGSLRRNDEHKEPLVRGRALLTPRLDGRNRR
jgi:hypothetical protein